MVCRTDIPLLIVVSPRLYTLHFTLYTLHSTPYTLHLTLPLGCLVLEIPISRSPSSCSPPREGQGVGLFREGFRIGLSTLRPNTPAICLALRGPPKTLVAFWGALCASLRKILPASTLYTLHPTLPPSSLPPCSLPQIGIVVYCVVFFLFLLRYVLLSLVFLSPRRVVLRVVVFLWRRLRNRLLRVCSSGSVGYRVWGIRLVAVQ